MEKCKACEEKFGCEYMKHRYNMSLCNMDIKKREEQNKRDIEARANMLANTVNIWRFS